MKRLLSAIVILLVALSCGQGYETFKGDALGTKLYTLDNGLKVYMSVNKDQPRIQTYIAVKVGGKNDPAETTGLAHYFEHLMFKGTEKFGTSDFEAEKPMLDKIEALFEIYRQTSDEAERKALYHQIDSISFEASKIAIPNEYDKLMAVIGANGTNAWTSQDETVYTEDIPSNQIENWAKIQADRFRNVTIRGFHTELETIYEEKNMSLTQDNRKIWETLDAALFPNHPYGKQTVLGTQEHLKNPSITNVKNYHDQYYVPNNIAICLSGDFDPDQMVAVIEKYFGDWQPNPEIPTLKYEPEAPITTPIVKEVYGLEAESVVMGWRLPGEKDLKTSAVATIASFIISNGSAGLTDINVMQAQRALSMYGGYSSQPDYSTFFMMASPKEGQTLEELRDISLEQIALLRNGDFDDELLPATINNIKLQTMNMLESNSSRARQYVNAFIAGIDWADACRELEYYEAVSKEDVIAFANEYLADNAYAIVYKKIGEDKTVQKISAPAITPIVTNRDNKSAFLDEITAAVVAPIEPVFTDFEKEMKVENYAPGVELLYKKNEKNGVFNLSYVFYYGKDDDAALGTAVDYISYLGTESATAEEIAKKLYNLACQYYCNTSATSTTVTITGLSENMEEAVKIVEDLILNAKPDEQILENIKSDTFTSRIRRKKSQSSCYSALTSYAYYGPEYIKNVTLSNEQIQALTSEELLSKIREVFAMGHEILYYGPMSDTELKTALAACHKVSEGAVLGEEKPISLVQTPGSSVLMAQYDAKQIYYQQYSNRGEKFNADNVAELSLYNEYFGSGMNSVVFQEMREARGLAYSSWASLTLPAYKDASFTYRAFIATQNDKMRQAIEAFDEIINQMPQSEAAFKIAKEGIISRIRTERTIGYGVLTSYLSCRRRGISEPLDKMIFDGIQDMSLQDVVKFQQEWVKDRNYTYAILGDIKDLDTDYLKTLGPVKVVTLEDIFGF